MKSKKIIKSGLQVLIRHKLRSFFMMLGFIIGTSSLILIVAIGIGSRQKMMDNIEKQFSASNIMIGAGGGMSGAFSGGIPTTLVLEDIETIKEEIANVEDYDPVQMLIGQDVKHGSNRCNAQIEGHAPAAEELFNRSVTNGEYFSESDMKSSARVALIGEKVVQDLFIDEDPINQEIRIGTVPFRVIGVLEKMGIDPHGIDKDYDIYIPITTLLRRLMNEKHLMFAKLKIIDTNKMEETVAQINDVLRERHYLTAQEAADFYILTPVAIQEMVDATNRIFTLFLPLIAAISLLISGVIIMNLMLMSINERKNEIGLRKAVGANSRDILIQFLAEATLITFIGGLIGTILGLLGVKLMSTMMEINFVFPINAILIGLLSSITIGLLAGVIPAQRAARLDPVESLR